MKRSATVKLQPSKAQEKTLFELAQATATIWNKINYERLKQFKKFGVVDFATTEKEAYYALKDWVGGSTVQQLARKNAEAWRSFFSLNRKKKLPTWFKPKPPKFVKEENGRKLFIIPLRNDQYRIDGNVIELKRLGKFGRLSRGQNTFEGQAGEA